MPFLFVNRFFIILVFLITLFFSINAFALTNFDTFEDGDSNSNPTWGVVSGTVGVTAAAKHDGVFGLVIGSGASSGQAVTEFSPTWDANGLEITWWIYAEDGAANNHSFVLSWEDTNALATNIARFNIETGAPGIHFQTIISGVDTDSGAIVASALDKWYKFKINIDGNGAKCLFTIYDSDGTTPLGTSYRAIPQGKIKRFHAMADRTMYIDTIQSNRTIGEANFIYNINKEVSIDFNSISIPPDGNTAVDWNWTVNGVIKSNDENFVYSPVSEYTDYNACLEVKWSGYDVNSYKCSTINSGKFYGDTNFRFFDETTGLATSATIDFNGTSYTGTSFYLPSRQITSDSATNVSRTFTITKTNYGTRYYKIDMNKYTDLNIGFLMLPDANGSEITFKFFNPTGTALLSNYDITITNNYWNRIATKNTSNASGELTLFINPADGNYKFHLTNGTTTYDYNAVSLTILKPKDEDTGLTIDANWTYQVSGVATTGDSNISDNQTTLLIYANTSDPYQIEIQSHATATTYQNRTYSIQLYGDPGSQTLEPYLLKTSLGGAVTIKTQTLNEKEPIPNMKIEIYAPTINGLKLIQSMVTDQVGNAYAFLKIGKTYTIRFFIGSTEYTNTVNNQLTIVATVSTYYFWFSGEGLTWISVPDLNTPIVIFTPQNNTVPTGTTNFSQQVFGSRANYVTITYYQYSDTNMLSGKTIIQTSSQACASGCTVTQAIAGLVFNTNKVLFVDVNVYYDNNAYFVLYRQSYFYQSGPTIITSLMDMRTMFGCPTNPLEPCGGSMIAAIIITIMLVGGIVFKFGFASPTGLGVIGLLILGGFAYVGWIWWVMYAIIVILTILGFYSQAVTS